MAPSSALGLLPHGLRLASAARVWQLPATLPGGASGERLPPALNRQELPSVPGPRQLGRPRERPGQLHLLRQRGLPQQLPATSAMPLCGLAHSSRDHGPSSAGVLRLLRMLHLYGLRSTWETRCRSRAQHLRRLGHAPHGHQALPLGLLQLRRWSALERMSMRRGSGSVWRRCVRRMRRKCRRSGHGRARPPRCCVSGSTLRWIASIFAACRAVSG